MTPLPLSPEYYPFIISQQPWKMNTRLQRPIVLQQTGSWCALFNEVNYIIASINLAAVHSTKSLLTWKPATGVDARFHQHMPHGSAGNRITNGLAGSASQTNRLQCSWRSRALRWTLVLCVVMEKLAAGTARACLQSTWARAKTGSCWEQGEYEPLEGQ